MTTSLCSLACMRDKSKSSSFSEAIQAQREPRSKNTREVPTVSPNPQWPCDSVLVPTPPGQQLQARHLQPFPSVICVLTLGWVLGLDHRLLVSPVVFHSCLDQGCTEVITTALPTAEPAPLTKDKAPAKSAELPVAELTAGSPSKGAATVNPSHWHPQRAPLISVPQLQLPPPHEKALFKLSWLECEVSAFISYLFSLGPS